jgi:hypothetical protein
VPVPQSCISLVVLEINSTPKPSITLLGPLKKLYIKEHTRWIPEDLRPIFHPYLPLLIFTAPQPPWIWACIWAYRGGQVTEVITSEGEAPHTILREETFSLRKPQVNMFQLDNQDPSARAWYSSGFMVELEEHKNHMGEVILTQDGDYIILRQKSQHKVIQIPCHILETSKRTLKRADGQSRNNAPSQCLTLRTSYQGVSRNGSNALITSGTWALAKDGTIANLTTNTSKGRLEVSLQTRNKGFNNGISTFDIAALPSTWSNLSNVSSTIQKAKGSKDSVRVVLNQDAKSWYDMSKTSRTLEEEQALPSVVVRDIDRIRFDNMNSWGKRTAAWLGNDIVGVTGRKLIVDRSKVNNIRKLEASDGDLAIKRARI